MFIQSGGLDQNQVDITINYQLLLRSLNIHPNCVRNPEYAFKFKTAVLGPE